nr:PEGA domain-containing protein [uncultured Methanoregula sp.]
MTRKVILFLIAFVLCLVCLSAVSATTRMAENNPVGQSSTGPADRAGATGDIPALGADFEEVTTTETTMVPVTYPTEEPTEEPTVVHTTAPTPEPTTISPVEPTLLPTVMPTTEETELPTMQPTLQPVTGETTSPVPGQLSPVAEFTSSQTSGSGPLTVSFTDRSLNTPTMWYWDFGDGGADSSSSPSHTYTDPGSYTVSLTASNMYGTDTITETDYITVNGEVMKSGAIYAQSVPAGATIYVNGNSYGTSPVTVSDLFAGTYSVMASLNGYYSDMQTITVPPGRTANYYPTLRASPNPPVITGAISAQSSPSGATIYVNGVNYGKTPLTVRNLVPATYSVMATLNGYKSSSQLITVGPGQTTGYNPTLQSQPGPVTTGAIFAQTEPDGATIYMNGVSYGVSPVTIPNLAPGTYSMKATMNGYSPDTRRITVSSGRTAFYNPTLYANPPPVGSGQGSFAVYSNAEGAQVYFDNVNEGSITNGVRFITVATTGTPFRSYRVECPGYTTLTGTITKWPASGETVKIQAMLVPSTVPTVPVTQKTRSPVPVTITLGALIGAGIVFVVAGNLRKNR